MVVRSGAVICGAVIMLVISSATMARSRTHVVHSIVAGRIEPRATIIGAASMYDPFRPGYREGGAQTASGERYDPSAWAAAIRADLRETFGGIRQGKQLRYALVERESKSAIVKINDVGPLKPGRIIDLDEQTMRYFDPTLRLGVISDVKVTLLPGDDWTPGPIARG